MNNFVNTEAGELMVEGVNKDSFLLDALFGDLDTPEPSVSKNQTSKRNANQKRSLDLFDENNKAALIKTMANLALFRTTRQSKLSVFDCVLLMTIAFHQVEKLQLVLEDCSDVVGGTKEQLAGFIDLCAKPQGKEPALVELTPYKGKTPAGTPFSKSFVKLTETGEKLAVEVGFSSTFAS